MYKTKIILSLSVIVISFLLIGCESESDRIKKAIYNEINIYYSTGTYPVQTESNVDEKTKYKMFYCAISKKSTAPSYLVITVKNKNTNEVKEICTHKGSLLGAICRETNCDTNKAFSIAKDRRNRYFEFANDKALMAIFFDLYSKADLDKFSTTLDINNIVRQVKEGKITEETIKTIKALVPSVKKRYMFAHLMFNNGIICGQSCLSANFECFVYFKTKVGVSATHSK